MTNPPHIDTLGALRASGHTCRSVKAEIIAAKSPHAVRLGKKAVYAQVGLDLAQAYEQTSRVMVENMLAADAKEGIAAFFERRAANWQSE